MFAGGWSDVADLKLYNVCVFGVIFSGAFSRQCMRIEGGTVNVCGRAAVSADTRSFASEINHP